MLALTVFAIGACRSSETSSAPSTTSTTDAAVGQGQEIAITDGGFAPRQLFAIVNRDITWTNRTVAPASVVFDNGRVSSGPIVPGATFVHRPDAPVSISYRSGSDAQVRGVIQVEPEEVDDRGLVPPRRPPP